MARNQRKLRIYRLLQHIRISRFDDFLLSYYILEYPISGNYLFFVTGFNSM